MNKTFENILDGLEKHFNSTVNKDMRLVYHHAMEIVLEVAEQYNDNWIPCSERLLEDDNYILLSFSNYSVPIVGRKGIKQ